MSQTHNASPPDAAAAQAAAAGMVTPRLLGGLLDLSRQARQAESAAEVEFLLVNEAMSLAPYRQSALWGVSEGVMRLSGVVQAEANAPYAQWLEQVCQHLSGGPADGTAQGPRTLTADDLPPHLAKDWADWWPSHALWLPTGHTATQGLLPGQAALVLVRDVPWTATETAVLAEWLAAAWHARRLLTRPSFQLRTWWRSWWHGPSASSKPWWRRPKPILVSALLVLLALPMRQTIMAPGELVPLDPALVRAPIDGVIDRFHVRPNQTVKAGDPLFSFDEVVFRSRLEVAWQALNTAEIDYRQTSQQALSDPKARMQLGVLMGRIDEKKAEVAFLREQSAKLQVVAPRDGIALLEDTSQWVGRHVNVGERVMRVAEVSQAEVEAWVSVGDAIELKAAAPVSLFLSASPLNPVNAQLRYMAFEAEQRPDGSYAYRVRAQLQENTEHRVGAKGTVKLYGGWVPLGYWLMRRPLAVLRTTLGV